MILEKALNWVEKLFVWVGQLVLFFMMCFVSLNVLLRYFFNLPIPGSDELIQEYLMPALVFLTMSYVLKHDGHIKITLLVDHLPRLINRLLGIIFNILSIIFFLLIAYGSYQRTMTAIQHHEFSASILSYPMAPAYSIVVIGGGLMAFRYIYLIIIDKYATKFHNE